MEAWLEYFAVLTGVIYVLLAARQNVWCWPAGIFSSAVYIYVNIEHRLYQDAILQAYYVLAGFYGWILWSRKPEKDFDITTISYSLKQNLKIIIAGFLLVPIAGYIFSKFGNSLSYFDSAVTIFSFIATWMTAKKIIQNWLFWIVIDLLAAVMYSIKQLYPTAILYVFFAIVAWYGYRKWIKDSIQK